MSAGNRNKHPCGIQGEHKGTCEQCREANVELGWAHVCRPCWETVVLADYYKGRGW